MTDMIGLVLKDQYKIIQMIGEGGMAAVFLARQMSVNRDVALKLIRQNFLSDERAYEFSRRFAREAQVIASLDHPFIVKIIDFGEDKGLHFLAMQYVSGGNLGKRIEGGAVDVDQALRWVEQIGSALDFAHQKGIVHRDLKPQNVLLDGQGNAILTDFGIARLLEQRDATVLTREGIAMGTPAYMSPEQWGSGDPIDGRADLYALGVMTYEMLTGTTPFHGDTPVKMMTAHLSGRVPPPQTLRPDLNPAIGGVLERMLAKEPDKRYQSAADFLAALRKAVTSGPVTQPIPAKPPAPRRDPDRTHFGEARPAMPGPETAASVRGRGRGPFLALGLIVLLIAVAGVVVLGVLPTLNNPTATLSANPGGETPTTTASTDLPVSPSAVVMLATTAVPASATSTPTITPSQTAGPTETPANTNTPSVTATASVSSDEQLATMVILVGMTLTASVPSATPTPTIDFQATIDHQATLIAISSFTATPTPTHTPDLNLTRTAERAATLTAMPTSTPTFTATFTPTHTATSTPSFTPTATYTPTFTPTHTPTVTLTPTETLTPTPSRPRLRVKTDATNLRSGPGTAFGRAGVVNAGDVFFIVGYFDYWYLIELEPGKNAWVYTNLIEVLDPSMPLERPKTIPAPPATKVPTKAPTSVPPPPTVYGGGVLTGGQPPANDRYGREQVQSQASAQQNARTISLFISLICIGLFGWATLTHRANERRKRATPSGAPPMGA